MARPKGSLNQRWQDKLEALLERDLFREVLGHLERLPDDKQAELKIKLMEFIVPKRKAVEMDANVKVDDNTAVNDYAGKLAVVKSA